MNFIVSTSELLNKLQIINGVIGTNTVLPILEDILFDIDKNALTLFATDLETSMSTQMEIECKESGKFAIPAKILIDTLKKLPNQPLTFQINDSTKAVKIISDNGEYKLSGENGDDFPKMPIPENITGTKAKSSSLLKAIGSTLFATGNDELRAPMTGVLFQMDPDCSTFIATDAHRLVRYKRNEIKTSEATAFIVPKKALNLLRNSLPNDDTNVNLNYNNSNAFFDYGDTKLICRLIDGKYPDYNAVIPKNNNNVLVVNKSELLGSLNRVAIYSNKTTNLIRLRITGSEINISAEDIDFANEAQERLGCQYNGEDMEIGFNAKFLIEMLLNIGSDEVSIELSSATKAGIILPSKENEDSDEDVLMIVMPVMLNVEAPVV
ncbi:MAG TPA: DNA polymerase III subunit beta [Bacteroidetes bacterium]|nr:DNA polymerase III subunit beta [Bacteroidota bacterium]